MSQEKKTKINAKYYRGELFDLTVTSNNNIFGAAKIEHSIKNGINFKMEYFIDELIKIGKSERDDKSVIFKEMALLKVVGNKIKIKKALNTCKKFNPIILDKTNKSIVIQITALRRELDKMSKNLKPLGLISVSRTGAVAMTRGAEIFN